MKRGVDCAPTAGGGAAAEVVLLSSNIYSLITISVLGARRVREQMMRNVGDGVRSCQTTMANIQSVAVRTGLKLCLDNKQGRLALLNHRTVHFSTP